MISFPRSIHLRQIAVVFPFLAEKQKHHSKTTIRIIRPWLMVTCAVLNANKGWEFGGSIVDKSTLVSTEPLKMTYNDSSTLTDCPLHVLVSIKCAAW